MEDQNSEIQEVTPQDQEIFNYVSDEEKPATETHESEESKQDRNWKELRLKAEQAEKERQEALERARMNEELLKAVLSKVGQPNPQTQQQEEVDEFEGIDPKEYLDFEQSRKAWTKDARKVVREEYEALEREKERQRFKDRLKSKYSDFDSVVNDANIALFEKQEPELAKAIAKVDDPYEMSLLAYHQMKAKGFAKSDEESIPAREVEKKLEKAEKFVPSPSSYNKRPIAAAFSSQYMTKEHKQQLQDEMLRYASMANGY